MKECTGAAFPHSDTFHDDGTYTHGCTGMTLRDYFAAKAMQSWLSCHGLDQSVGASGLSKRAYQVADAMLIARGT